MKYCHQCGKQLTDEARFCDGCGAAAGSGNENIAESNVRTNLPGMKQPAIPNQDLKNGVDHSLEQSAISFQTNTAGTAKSGKGKKIILIVILTILLLGGGVWGWQRFGTEAGAQKQLDLAVKYISENDFEKAILAYNEAIRIDEKEVKAYQGLAKVYTLQEKYDQAQDTYEKGMTAVAAQDKSTLQLGLAGMYIDQGELDKAEQAFKEMKNADKHCLEAYWGLAMAYQQKGDQVQAKSILTQAIKENPKEYRTYNTLALYQSQNGENEPAFENIINSLQLEINQQEAYLVMNEMYQDNWQALRDKSRSISNQKLTAMLEFYAYYKEENYQKSIEIYKEALASNKENQKARILTAIAMSKKGDAAEGKELIAALGKDQINGWLLSDLAEYYLISGDKEKARKIAIDALEAYSTNLDAVSVLQKINSKDVAGKRYSAEFLLYNWKPVCTVKNALRAIAAPFPETNLKTQ
ncbi:MAG: tetratricopeptide repeat protein, partial [Methanobacterium sp.]